MRKAGGDMFHAVGLDVPGQAALDAITRHPLELSTTIFSYQPKQRIKQSNFKESKSIQVTRSTLIQQV